MNWHAVWICIATMLATLDISKAVDEDGKTIEPSYEYVSSLAWWASCFSSDKLLHWLTPSVSFQYPSTLPM